MLLLLTVAAFAFDTGQMMVSRRTQQDVSDAAALAGARELLNSADPSCQGTPSLSNCPRAVAAALQIAQLNGYGDGVTNCAVTSCTGKNPQIFIKIPAGPEAPEWAGAGTDVVEVQIANTDPAIFSGVLGIPNWNVGAMAVAANGVDVALPYSFLSLDPSTCGAVTVTGASPAGITSQGNIQVDSNCSGALAVGNNATLDVTSGACNIVGGLQRNGHPTIHCAVNPGSPYVPDPLTGLVAPTQPPLAVPPSEIGGTLSAPANCPSTIAIPQACQFSNNTAYNGTTWILHPGTYPGGIQLNATATFCLEPGIYYLAGGGFTVTGGGPTVASVANDAACTSTPTIGGGVLIYNTNDPSATTTCAGGNTNACVGSISLNGTTNSVTLLPYQSPPYENMVIFEDRTQSVSSGYDLTLNGSGSNLNVTGTIYMPKGSVKVNGSNSTAMNTQIIAWDFLLSGNGGNMTVGYQASSFFHVRGSGLVQ